MTEKLVPSVNVENLHRKFLDARQELVEALREAYPVKVKDIVTSQGIDYRVWKVRISERSASVFVTGNARCEDGSFDWVCKDLGTDWRLKEDVSPTNSTPK